MKRVLFDIAALVARVTIGVIFIAHGWQKWQNGLDATTQMFTQAGVPQPQLAAGFTSVAEIVGGAFLVLGLLVPFAGLALLAVSVGAILFVHGRNGIFVGDNGWELVGALGAASLLFAAVGGGRFGLDGIFKAMFRRRAERRVADKEIVQVPEPATHVQAVPAPDLPLPKQREQQVPRHAAPTAEAPQPVPGQKAQDWTEEDLKQIDELFADNKPGKDPRANG